MLSPNVSCKGQNRVLEFWWVYSQFSEAWSATVHSLIYNRLYCLGAKLMSTKQNTVHNRNNGWLINLKANVDVEYASVAVERMFLHVQTTGQPVLAHSQCLVLFIKSCEPVLIIFYFRTTSDSDRKWFYRPFSFFWLLLQYSIPIGSWDTAIGTSVSVKCMCWILASLHQ